MGQSQDHAQIGSAHMTPSQAKALVRARPGLAEDSEKRDSCSIPGLAYSLATFHT